MIGAFRRPFAALALAALCLATAPEPARAASMFDPDVHWRTIVTPHFRVNYPAEHEAVARLAAGYAEEAHKLLSPYLESVPANRTELTLLDHEDTTNGFGFPLPNNQIFIYLASPTEDSLMGRYDAWLRDLLIHEYTHVLHMEKTAGLPAWINGFFGRSYFPNVLQPIFLIEGLAVHTETRYSHGGRGRDTAYRSVLRMAALDGRMSGIDQAAGYNTIDHPGGEVPYIYGMAFYRHMAKHYGADAPAELAKRYAYYPFFGLYGIDQCLKEITGRDANTLWQEMQTELTVEAKIQKLAIEARGPLTPLHAITAGGMYHRHPRFLPDGELIWAEWTGHSYSNMVGLKAHDAALTPGGPTPRRIMSKGPFGNYTVSTDGRTIYHGRNWDENRFTSYEDVFSYDTKDRTLTRLSVRARIDEPAISPDGRQVVAVQGGGGQTNLVIMNKDGSKRRALTHLRDFTQFGGPCWHPKGGAVAVTAWHEGARDLFFVDATTGRMQRLWHDRALDLNPTWSPDGRYLVFCSDRDGIFNIYAYDHARRQLFRMTNVVGGLLEPAVSADGKTMAATTYGSTGYDIATFPWDPKTWTAVPFPKDEPGVVQPAPRPLAADAPLAPAELYNPLPSLRPKTWAPFSFSDERGPILGFTTIGQDALFQHYLYAAVGHGLVSNRPFYSISYSNDAFYPSLNFSITDTPLLSQPVQDGVAYQLAQRGQYASASMTLPGLPSAFLQGSWVTGDTWSFGLNTSYIQTLTPNTQNIPERKLPVTGRTTVGSIAYRYGDNYKFSYSVAPEGGSLATVGYERALPGLGSEHVFDRVWIDWRRYLALGGYHPWLKHHALAFRAFGGANFGQRGGNFYLGGYESATLLSNADLRTASGVGTSQLPLRGYGYGVDGGPLGSAASLEYRFPLLGVQRGYGIYPIFVRQVHGAVFAEGGQAWAPGAFRWDRSLYTVGGELRAQANFMQAPTEVRLGLGQGLVPVDGYMPWPQLFVDAGTFF